MRLIKTKPRYHCDFCSHTSTKAAMEAHEKICWMNPNRYCSSCNNTGFYSNDIDGLPPEECYYCKRKNSDINIVVRQNKTVGVIKSNDYP